MGLEVVRKRGKFTQVGIFGRNVELPFDVMWRKEITIHGSASQKRSAWLRALSLLSAGQVQTAPLITDTFPITEWDAAIRKAMSRDGIKVSLVPAG
jgi:L-iditol 2-dehydrogenase